MNVLTVKGKPMLQVEIRKVLRANRGIRMPESKADKRVIDTSIKKLGIVNALRCNLWRGKFYCTDGRRRLASARRLGLKYVPVVVGSKLLEQLYLMPVSTIWAAIEIYSVNQIGELLGWTNDRVKGAIRNVTTTAHDRSKRDRRKPTRKPASEGA